MLQVLTLLILFSDLYSRVQAILMRDAIISCWKLYVCKFHLWYSIKCLMHPQTIFYVNIELCCKCWYCWFFFLTYTAGSRPFRRGTPSSPVENCYVFTFHLWYIYIYIDITLNTCLIVCAHDCILCIHLLN